MTLVDEFKEEHSKIQAGLVMAEAVASDPLRLLGQLKAMRAEVLAHFTRKDALYPLLTDQCTRTGDAAGAQLTRIFESNMRVQSAAVKRFFEGLESSAPAVVSSSFRTVTSVIRQRFGTEEQAIFPIYKRTFKEAA